MIRKGREKTRLGQGGGEEEGRHLSTMSLHNGGSYVKKFVENKYPALVPHVTWHLELICADFNRQAEDGPERVQNGDNSILRPKKNKHIRIETH